MNISSAVFDLSCPDLRACPDSDMPEFAFIGRSNVGKSSLLNMLAGKSDLARVSTTPGHTRMINMFTINRSWRLVDLPGYGHAHVAREDRSQFNMAVAEYLEHRNNLLCVFTLIDGSLPPQKIDLLFIQWLAEKSVPFVLVFTKIDRVRPGRLKENMQAFLDCILEWCVEPPQTFTCSSITKHGRRDLLQLIAETVAAAEEEDGAQETTLT